MDLGLASLCRFPMSSNLLNRHTAPLPKGHRTHQSTHYETKSSCFIMLIPKDQQMYFQIKEEICIYKFR